MIHLHNHSEFSSLDGVSSPEKWVLKAKELGQSAIALTEHGNMLSAIQLQSACKKHDIKPLFGAEFYFVDDVLIKTRQSTHMLMLAKNNQGFKDLQALCSYANIHGFYYKPKIDIKKILEIDLRNIIISTACPGGWLNNSRADQHIQVLLENNADIVCEIQPHDLKLHYDFNKKVYNYALKYNLDLIMTCDAHYPDKTQSNLQDVLMTVATRGKMTDKNRIKLPCDTYYLWSEQECLNYKHDFIPKEEIEISIRNTQSIADECNVEINKKKIILPIPPKIKQKTNRSASDVLWQSCMEGFKNKLNIDISIAENETPEFYFAGNKEKADKYEIYIQRLNEEFDLFEKKDLCRYFLIVKDVVDFARSVDIPVGPGRGSCSGSLVSYLLNLTHLDPIEHNLIFARFLNEQRNDYPDIDIDFSQKRRHEIVKYITETYGKDRTGYIVTLLRMGAKTAVRDVSRVFDINLKEVDVFAKSCFSYEGDHLEEGLNSAYGRIFNNKYPHVVDYIKKSQGSIRGTSIHASGIIVNKKSLMSGSQCTILRDKGKSVKRICGTIMGDCEDNGLLKLDVLGLATLDVIHNCRRESGIEWEDIAMDNRNVFKEISSGNTLGAFQIEAKASTQVVKKMKPNNFDDLSACLALVRPGPMDSGMTDMYIDRKNGTKWDDIHPFYTEITRKTYGVLAYQEQVMECIVKLAGLPFSEADNIRKIIGKKREAKEFEPYWEKFRQGCIKQKTLSPEQAKEFWDGLLKWASYGFNKCLSGDTVVIIVSGNQHTKIEVTIRELYDSWYSNSHVGEKYKKQGITVLQMDDDGKIRPGKIKKIYKNGIKVVFKVILENGMSIKGTHNHKILTHNGYKRIDSLSIGSVVVIKGEYEKTNKSNTNIADKTRGTGETYNGKGFKRGEKNIGFIDGRSITLKASKKVVFKRSMGVCERCGIKKDSEIPHTYEYAHIIPLEILKGDFSKYHADKNLLYLCSNCHKKYDYLKGERIKRYSKGIPTIGSRVIKIVDAGLEMTYDVEMETVGHNFIANGIVSHNSHSASYSLITYWCMWYKINCPEIFYAAALSFAKWDEKHKDVAKSKLTMIELMIHKQYKIMTPKYGLSKGHVWAFNKQTNTFYMPFDCINGIDDKADFYAKTKQKHKKISIFDEDEMQIIESENKMQLLLAEMMCHDKSTLPSRKLQKDNLQFVLPYQKNVSIKQK